MGLKGNSMNILELFGVIFIGVVIANFLIMFIAARTPLLIEEKIAAAMEETVASLTKEDLIKDF
jgi:hypothetical protein